MYFAAPSGRPHLGLQYVAPALGPTARVDLIVLGLYHPDCDSCDQHRTDFQDFCLAAQNTYPSKCLLI
jgi:hypothetical protein